MIDIELLRTSPDLVRKTLELRNNESSIVDEILIVDREWRKIKSREDELRAERNKVSKSISERVKKKEDISELKARASAISNEVKELTQMREGIEQKRLGFLLKIPNILHRETPAGKDEKDNIEIKKWGVPKRHSTDVLSHYDWGKKTRMLDFDRGSKLGGHRFTVLKHWGAKLERALINFMLNLHTSRGYMEIAPPHMVKTEIIRGTGQLPKFADDLYKIEDDDLWLIPTAEVPLVGLFNNEIIDENDLPMKVTAYTPCYRREAGAYGKDIQGMIRQHQFDKIELVQITKPENSEKQLEELLEEAELVLKQLELPYRVITLCSGDVGFAAAKTYDIEVWIPSQDKYREISSCSTCTDFQARRSNIKYRKKGELLFPHTLNGSGLAVGRTLVAIIENYQEDGGVVVPKVLRDFVGIDYIDGVVF